MSRRGIVIASVALWVFMAGSTPAQRVGWRQAEPSRRITLPADHASHPEYRIEWWYYTGNLEASDGRRFGYQLTFFRSGVEPHPAGRSRWAVRDLYMAHLAVTDVSAKRHRFVERINRAGPGWAGAATDRYRVWNEDWSVVLETPGVHRLEAVDRAVGVDLRLLEDRPAVLHGTSGYSQKGSAPGNASHYYSLTRMPTIGWLIVDGERIEVSGLSWMDHEFGTSFLEPDQRGWDWLAIQLDDGHDLMVYQLRQSDGSISPQSIGTVVEADGRTFPIRLESGVGREEGLRGFSLEPGRVWRSKETGAAYPVVWRLRIARVALDLMITAVVDQQEMRTEGSAGVSYWEGAVDALGEIDGKPVRGRGYLEMTGYAGTPIGSLFSPQ